jgi:hypothetical protein
MGNEIKWEYDPIKTKQGNSSKSVLYGDDCFVITTHPNRFLSTNLENNNRVTLLYKGEYDTHRYWGTLEQMKSLSQQIKDNQFLFNRFTFLDCAYSNSVRKLCKDIDFNSL